MSENAPEEVLIDIEVCRIVDRIDGTLERRELKQLEGDFQPSRMKRWGWSLIRAYQEYVHHYGTAFHGTSTPDSSAE